ncbi:hypothetical protein SCACP_36750 [Sporomusa carbonis]|uniref:HD-GYP domain-containing protein n=1 Tax=Sporomusa carbonis TaxID=3076075 RepID=UPI003A6417D4
MILPVFVKNLTPGMVLGRDIILDGGRILIKKGAKLTDEHISCLTRLTIRDVYIISGTDIKQIIPFNEKYQDRLCSSQSKQKTLGEVIYAFESVRLFGQVPVTRMIGLTESSSLLTGNMADVVHIIDMVKIKSEHTYRHCVNVGIISAIIGNWLDYSGNEIRNLILAGLLHDIGKAIIPLEILNKPSKLNDEEMLTMRRHSTLSYNFLSDFNSISWSIKVGALQHHERLDGSGYPVGLEDEDIHEFAKIIAIADTYDAITSDRVYRPRKAPTEALKIIQDEICDGKLDPRIGRVFLEKASRFFLRH